MVIAIDIHSKIFRIRVRKIQGTYHASQMSNGSDDRAMDISFRHIAIDNHICSTNQPRNTAHDRRIIFTARSHRSGRHFHIPLHTGRGNDNGVPTNELAYNAPYKQFKGLRRRYFKQFLPFCCFHGICRRLKSRKERSIRRLDIFNIAKKPTRKHYALRSNFHRQCKIPARRFQQHPLVSSRAIILHYISRKATNIQP